MSSVRSTWKRSNTPWRCVISSAATRYALCGSLSWFLKCFPFRNLSTSTSKILPRKSKPRNCLRTIAKWLLNKIKRLKCNCRPTFPRRISTLANGSRMLLKRSQEPSKGKCVPCLIRLARRRRSTQPRRNIRTGATSTMKFEVKPFSERHRDLL